MRSQAPTADVILAGATLAGFLGLVAAFIFHPVEMDDKESAIVGGMALDRLVVQPPAFRRKPVLELVEALGPTSLDFGASIEFALVVGSQELGVGGKLKSVPLALGTEIADLVLKELGVPE